MRKSVENPKLTTPEIKEAVVVENISVRTVQRRLNKSGLFGWSPAKKTFFKIIHVKNCLKFAKQHISKANGKIYYGKIN